MSTTVLSDLRTKPCLRKAGATNYHVYLRSKASIHPDLHPWYDSVGETWDPPIVVQDPESGFYSQFYRPKMPPDSPGYCPPVLVFRGSETEPSDFARLSLVLRFNFTFASNVPRSIVLTGLNMANAALNNFTNDGVFIPAHGAGQGATHEEVLAWVQGLTNQRDVAAFSGTTDISFRRENMSPFNDDMIDETITVGYNISARLHFDHQGDWGTNITQGMGELTEQYDLAAQQGQLRAAEALADWNGKLIVTGHSLGGGLAANAAIAGAFHTPECDITCVTYNAAGVHENSVHEYVSRSATLGQNSNTQNFSVNDEILNTMQIQQGKLPLVQPFIRWANAIPGNPAMGFSPARNDTAVTPGISPGSTGMGTFAPAYEALPVLWPVSQNTIAEAQVKLQSDESTNELRRQAQAHQDRVLAEYDAANAAELARLQQELDDAWSITAAQRERNAGLQQQIDDIATGRQAVIDNLAQEYATRVPTFPDISNVSNFPTITAMDAMAQSAGSADNFVRGLIGYIMTGEMNPHRAGGFTLNQDVTGQAQTRIEQLITEFRGIPPIGIAAVMYHTFDPCAFTFHNPRG